MRPAARTAARLWRTRHPEEVDLHGPKGDAVEQALALLIDQCIDEYINTPQTREFLEAVMVEATHQRERWGEAHDRIKSAADWFWLLGYLAGKALHAPGKRLHHIISSAAVLLQWHRAEGE